MDSSHTIRTLKPEDEPVLWTMLSYAAHEPSLAVVKANPDLARYVQGWHKTGGVGAIAEQDSATVGAAWLRLWSTENRGYGYLSTEIPELAIAVIPEGRNQGIGTALLKQTLVMARSQFSAVCLSIRADNPALRLYERLGFVPVKGTEVTNRSGGVSLTMICKLDSK